jgi:hypothetical protein
LQDINQFALHPLGLNGIGRKHQQKPITSRQGLTDLVVPLLGATDALPTVEDLQTVTKENSGKPSSDGLVPGSVGKEDFSGFLQLSQGG